MLEDSFWRTVRVNSRARALERRWQKICSKYLPHTPDDSIWRYRYPEGRRLPPSGWKLHVSATILNAPAILERIAPLLVRARVQYKAARSLDEILKLNSGLIHSYTQIGKIITIYPRTDREAVYLAQRLHQLTRRFKAPSVPFDLRFATAGNIYYRYGAFKRIEVEQPNGERLLVMQTPSGELVPDVREKPKPDWASDPFKDSPPVATRLASTNDQPFHVVSALVQRGKGGVYQAIDFSSQPPRPCLLKEGRKLGELSWDGRDGAWRVRNEERVLASLSAHGLNVPGVYSRFELRDNFYLVMEFIDGESLHNRLLRQTRRFPIKRMLSLGIEIADLLAQMHRAGWAWRDCKPTNLIITRRGKVVPIDFEGAEAIDHPDPIRWGTAAFTPRTLKAETGCTEDVYALGSVLYLLATGRIFDPSNPVAIEKLRRRVPPELRQLVHSLLADKPEKRPSAQSVRARLTSILLKSSTQPLPRQDARAA